MSKHTSKGATFVSELDSDMKIQISGENLKFKAGELVGGRVTSVEFSCDGDTYLRINDASLKASLVHQHMDTAGAGVYIDALRGRDSVNGI